ncbi:afadin [Parasponia andersonii]|uniref:Afadin n=1 Tax=Parasponia andersonii TaxID=3476 RepID=A0A2P5DHQ9_PARAD|nr:afadin [Parasponia andersonii]
MSGNGKNLGPKRSKISTGTPTHRSSSSTQRFLSRQGAFTQGNRLVQIPRNVPNLASDSSSCSSGTADDDSFTFELGLRSSKQASGTPIKKLLAKEMSRETESQRRSPSVVAKLMGLDGLPPQQPAWKEEKGISEGYLQTIRSVEKGQRSSRRYDSKSCRKSSKDEQEFKDVFEVLETSKAGSSSYPSQETVNSNLTDAEMAFIRQKFVDAKRLSSDEKLQGSKEFHEALDVLDSNKDLLVKFLQHPDSLFTKHLHDLQGATPQPLCGRIAAMKSSEAEVSEKTQLDGKSTREALHKNRSGYSQRHRDRRTSHSDFSVAQNALRSSKNQLEGKDEPAILPTRIVVLKPNLGKVLNVNNAVSSPCSSHTSLPECRKDIEIPIIKSREVELLGRRNFHRDVGLSGHKSRESRELAKEITRQMKNSFSNSSVKFSSSVCKGYAGDESSCSMSGNESANELETMSTNSKYSFDLNNQRRPLSCHSTESSVSREAKKRLSERWQLTHKSLDMAVVSRGSTLAEMLAIPDKEKRLVHLDGMTDEEGFRNKIACDDGPSASGWVEPLGISSRDGWKDGCIGNLTRSRSLPSSSTAFGSPKAITRREPIRDDRYVIPKEALMRERNKAQKNKLDKKSVNGNSRSSGKKSHSSHSSGESNDYSTKTLANQNQVSIKLETNRPTEQKIDSLAGILIDMSPVPKSPEIGARETIMSSEPLENLLPELSPHTLVADVCHFGDQDDLNSQEPLTEPREESSLTSNHSVPGLESPASSKEAEQPSPVSVLEVPFKDDVSYCSECFESISADLQGLRMQLQLLKLESESYEEGPMLISSDDDVGEGSSKASDAIGLSVTQQNWESCYVVDVLIHSGLNNADPNMFLAVWHTPDCPLSPFLFEELEKKYSVQTTLPKSERRLLFDRISCGILEMYQPFTDPHPWIRSNATTMLGPRWFKNELQDGLCQLLAIQAKNVRKDTTEKVLGRESDWLDMSEDIDVIGREIETLLLDELVEELVAM